MTTEVVTVPTSATLREVASQLLENGVGSVIVVDDAGNPDGIVTESDVLEAAYRSGEALDELPVTKLSHGAVVTTGPDATVQRVARKMADENVKKVPVLEDFDLVGMVTLTDIVWHLPELRKEATSLGQAHKDWELDE